MCRNVFLFVCVSTCTMYVSMYVQYMCVGMCAHVPARCSEIVHFKTKQETLSSTRCWQSLLRD